MLTMFRKAEKKNHSRLSLALRDLRSFKNLTVVSENMHMYQYKNLSDPRLQVE